MHLLIFRFSAMGDVVLTLPVIRGLLNAYPNLKVTLVTRKNFSPFFSNIERLKVFSPDFSKRHKGFFGVFRLFIDIKKMGQFDYIIDLHSVLRTHFLCFLFKLKGEKCLRLKKERSQKKAALKFSAEPNFKHTTERYIEVFRTAGFKFELANDCSFNFTETAGSDLKTYLDNLNLKNSNFVGIAPFAKHSLKVYPYHHLSELINKLSARPIDIFLFGGGKLELEKLNYLASGHENIHVVNLGLTLEILLMKHLKVIITMDSANMHIASLTGIPVISIWGATHPGIGFGPLNQPTGNTIQISVSELGCRPCTIYGKGKCRRGDFACMERINPQIILSCIEKFIE
jgi:ADP-heptose:LPS heptosyltransferase